ncbi:MAG: SPOR domain-containing protein [Halioglobus sp.]
MARDYAKQRKAAPKRAPARKSAPARKKASSSNTASSPWRWYGSGLLSGFFLSFLLYMGTLPQSVDNISEAAPAVAEPVAATPPKPRFDFYTLLPEQRIEVDVDPAEVTQKRPTSATETYVLQAGSFKQKDDADRRRAELLLLGLTPNIEETNGDNGHWYRVYLGPFVSRSTMAKARGLTAAQNIDTLLLKRGAP